MYNFFVLEQGDKWAKTGTRFKPRSKEHYPRADGAKMAEAKKERVIKSSPSLAPQWPSRAATPRSQEAPPAPASTRATEAPRRPASSAKLTPHAIRPLGGRNAHIMGNRSSPPPASSERARLDAMLLDAAPAAASERVEDVLGKRRRLQCDEDSTGSGALHAPDVPSARRLRTVESGTYSAYHSSSPKTFFSHSRPRYCYPHPGAATLGEDEQAYLYRMRPEVRAEVLAPMLADMRDRRHGFSQRNLSAQEASMSRRRMDITEAMHHRETYLPAYQSPNRVRVAMPVEHEYAHDARDEVVHHQHEQQQRDAAWEAPTDARLRIASDMLPMRTAEDGSDEVYCKAADLHDDASICTEACDAFSSCWSTPDSVPICNEFVGSPLDLGENECLSALLEDASGGDSAGVKRVGACLGLEDHYLDEPAWSMHDFVSHSAPAPAVW